MGYQMIEDLQDFDAVGGFSVSPNGKPPPQTFLL